MQQGTNLLQLGGAFTSAGLTLNVNHVRRLHSLPGASDRRQQQPQLTQATGRTGGVGGIASRRSKEVGQQLRSKAAAAVAAPSSQLVAVDELESTAKELLERAEAYEVELSEEGDVGLQIGECLVRKKLSPSEVLAAPARS